MYKEFQELFPIPLHSAMMKELTGKLALLDDVLNIKLKSVMMYKKDVKLKIRNTHRLSINEFLKF